MKDKNMIEELYDLLQEKMYYGPYENQIMCTQKALMDMIGDDPEKESAIMNYGVVYEKAGFYNGFRFSTLLLSACIDKESVRIPEISFFSTKE